MPAKLFRSPLLRFLTTSLSASFALLALGCQPSNKKGPDDKQEPSPKVASGQTQGASASGSVDELAMVAGDTPFARDLQRICFQLTLSGANEVSEANWAMHAGVWLAKSIESQEGREFSARLSQATLSERIDILRAKSLDAGMPRCAIVDFWETLESPVAREDGVEVPAEEGEAPSED